MPGHDAPVKIPAGIDLIECPYMPAGFVAFREADGSTVVLNTQNGFSFKLPPIGFTTAMPSPFRPSVNETAINAAVLWRYRNR